MRWKCPACAATIEHVEEAPRPGVVYRCNVCRLELVIDLKTGKLTPANASESSS